MYRSTRHLSAEEADETHDIITAEAGEEMARMLGRITSTYEITMVAHSAVSDTVLLSQLVTLSSSLEKRVGFMASWALSKVVDMNTEVLSPYLAADDRYPARRSQ